MKLAEKKVVTTYVPNIKKGRFYELTDTVSCDVINIKVLNVTNIGILFFNLRNNKMSQIYFKNADKYEIRELKLTYVNEEDVLKERWKNTPFLTIKFDKEEKEKEFLKNLTGVSYLMSVEEYLDKVKQEVNKEM